LGLHHRRLSSAAFAGYGVRAYILSGCSELDPQINLLNAFSINYKTHFLVLVPLIIAQEFLCDTDFANQAGTTKPHTITSP
jgi:hypothetical protein